MNNLNSSPNNKFLNMSKSRALAKDKINKAQTMTINFEKVVHSFEKKKKKEKQERQSPVISLIPKMF